MKTTVQPEIAIIAAIADNGAIGYKGQIPWKIKEELELFKQKTAGGWLICGTTTYKNHLERLQGKDDRIVVPVGKWENCRSLGEAIQYCGLQPNRKIWICGGARLYCEALQLPLVTELHLSFINAEPIADTFFPRLYNPIGYVACGSSKWEVTEGTSLGHMEKYGFVHQVYKRV